MTHPGPDNTQRDPQQADVPTETDLLDSIVFLSNRIENPSDPQLVPADRARLARVIEQARDRRIAESVINERRYGVTDDIDRQDLLDAYASVYDQRVGVWGHDESLRAMDPDTSEDRAVLTGKLLDYDYEHGIIASPERDALLADLVAFDREYSIATSYVPQQDRLRVETRVERLEHARQLRELTAERDQARADAQEWERQYWRASSSTERREPNSRYSVAVTAHTVGVGDWIRRSPGGHTYAQALGWARDELTHSVERGDVLPTGPARVELFVGDHDPLEVDFAAGSVARTWHGTVTDVQAELTAARSGGEDQTAVSLPLAMFGEPPTDRARVDDTTVRSRRVDTSAFERNRTRADAAAANVEASNEMRDRLQDLVVRREATVWAQRYLEVVWESGPIGGYLPVEDAMFEQYGLVTDDIRELGRLGETWLTAYDHPGYDGRQDPHEWLGAHVLNTTAPDRMTEFRAVIEQHRSAFAGMQEQQNRYDELHTGEEAGTESSGAADRQWPRLVRARQSVEAIADRITNFGALGRWWEREHYLDATRAYTRVLGAAYAAAGPLTAPQSPTTVHATVTPAAPTNPHTAPVQRQNKGVTL